MTYVYAILGVDRRLYVGVTSDLRRRFREHQLGQTQTTKGMGELRLVFYEAFLSKKDASRQERFYKTGYGREVLRGKLEDTLETDNPEE